MTGSNSPEGHYANVAPPWYPDDCPSPSEENSAHMWEMVEELFPIYRSLCGPGYRESLQTLAKHIDLEISEYPSGMDVSGWTIPKEFFVNEAWVENEAGERIIDYSDHVYHVWIYSQSFDGIVDRDELVAHIGTLPHLPDVIPMRQSYYRPKWGLCATQRLVDSLPVGKYRVHIDTEHKDGFLRLGEYCLPGESKKEILINSYLCHPAGANDNLSGIVVAVELFRLLAQLPRRQYTYRLLINPETIGAITYATVHRERLKDMVGGYHVLICGDSGPVNYNETFYGSSIFDRAARHAMRQCGWTHDTLKYKHSLSGCDSRIFNAAGLRIPVGVFSRSGPGVGTYPEYHSSADDLSLIHPAYLRQTLEVLWYSLLTVERAMKYKGNYVVDPFLEKHGVFPYHHGVGEGRIGTNFGYAYYELLGGVDGQIDLLEIADRSDMPILAFDEPVSEFLRVGLMDRVPD